jgi:hypothetical protein
VAQWRSPTERPGWPAIPTGRTGQTDTRTSAQQKVDGRPLEVDRCPTEDVRVPDREWEWPNGGRDGCPTEGGSWEVAQLWVSGVA